MKRLPVSLHSLLTLAILSFAAPAYGEFPPLRGQVYFIGDADEETPAANVSVSLEGWGTPTTTLNQGDFELDLPTRKEGRTRVPVYPPGAPITLVVKKPGWVLHIPLGGKRRSPMI